MRVLYCFHDANLWTKKRLESAIEIENFFYVTTRGGRGDVSVCAEFAREWGGEGGGRNYKNICTSQERLDGDWLGML